MTQKSLKYCSVRYFQNGHSGSTIVIRFPEPQSKEEWEISFQKKRADAICARVRALPFVKGVGLHENSISIHFQGPTHPQALIPRLGSILRDEEAIFEMEDHEETKREIQKLLDSLTEEKNTPHRSKPALQQGLGAGVEVETSVEVIRKRSAEMEARLDQFVKDGGLTLRDTKSAKPHSLYAPLREVTYRFPTGDGFLVIISILWQPSQEPLAHPIPVILAEVLISEIPEEDGKDFFDVVLRINKRISIPIKIGWIYDRCFGLCARWHIDQLELPYQDHCLRALLPIATDVYQELRQKFPLPTWKEHCEARERMPS